MTLGVYLSVLYILGIVASLGVMNALGNKNPTTIGDCYSGDSVLDFTLSLIWPIYWPLLITYKIFYWLFS